MKLKNVASHTLNGLRIGLGSLALFQFTIGAPLANAAVSSPISPNPTRTPIKHVIVIVGENRSFDHVFATYVPKKKNERVWNLLSEGIVNADGTPGPNF
jgi:phospholipase C